MTADLLGVHLGAITIEYGDTDLPPGPAAGGSAQTASVAQSLIAACDELKRSLHRLARQDVESPLRASRYEQVEASDGALQLRGSPGAAARYAAILQRAGKPQIEVRIGSDGRIGRAVGVARYMTKLIRDSRRWARFGSGAQFCEVRVDPDTMEVRVTR